MQRQAPLPSAPSGPPAAANPQPVWYASPGAPRDRCPRLPWGPAALPLGGGDEVPVARDVRLGRGRPARVAPGDQPVEHDLRVGGALPGLVVDKAGVAAGHGGRGAPAAEPAGPRPGSVAPGRPRPLAGGPRPSAELREVDVSEVERAPGLPGHALEGLVHDPLQVIASVSHLIRPPDTGAST